MTESRESQKARISQPIDQDENRDEAQKLEGLREEANSTANQTAEDGGIEVQGKLAVPTVEVQKRGSTKVTDKETGQLVKTTNSEEDSDDREQEEPEYLRLHREVVEGADPLEATLKYQKSADEQLDRRSGASREAKDASIETPVRRDATGQGPLQTAEEDRKENE